jgi:pimeloyl-ACP methyl ester carboxylesterase
MVEPEDATGVQDRIMPKSIGLDQTAPQSPRAGDDLHPQLLALDAPPRRIAYLARRPAGTGLGRPGVVWLGGFKSDMRATKATALDGWATETGRGFLRFDYSGHGDSDGRFEDGTIGLWLAEALAAIDRAQADAGRLILVGSSMGGWIALLAARALHAAGKADWLAGMVLIAPATDFTEALIWARLTPAARRAVETTGAWLRPSAYQPEPYPITRALIEDGRRHLLLGGSIRTHCPIHILQGMADEDVPWRHAMTLAEHLAGDPVVVTLVKDGDHRLSRPQDLARLIGAVEAVA